MTSPEATPKYIYLIGIPEPNDPLLVRIISATNNYQLADDCATEIMRERGTNVIIQREVDEPYDY